MCNGLENEDVRRLGKLYEKIISLRDNDDYAINQPQMDKLIDVLNFFLDAAKKSGGEVDPVKLVPKEEHGGVTATFVVFDIYGDDMKRFSSVIQHCSAMTIDSDIKNQICISVTVPEVFVPVKK